MKPYNKVLIVVLVLLVLGGTACYLKKANKEDKQGVVSSETEWVANSTTAMSITGDIKLSSNTVTFMANVPDTKDKTKNQLKISLLKNIQNDPVFEEYDGLNIYKVTESNSGELVNGNVLCGVPGNIDKPTFLVVGYSADKTSMSLALFTGVDEPQWTKEFIGNTHDLCGTFSYSSKSN